MVAELRRRRSNNASFAKLAKKGDLTCLLQVRNNAPDPLGSPLITQPTPMPVDIAPLAELQPFFDLLTTGRGATREFLADNRKWAERQKMNAKGEQFAVPFVQMKRGTLFADGRMDMCKQVVGDEHIGELCEAVGRAKCFLTLDEENEV